MVLFVNDDQKFDTSRPESSSSGFSYCGVSFLVKMTRCLLVVLKTNKAELDPFSD